MKKVSSLVLALVLGVTGAVFAAGASDVMRETKSAVTVDGKEFKAGTQGTEVQNYTYDHAVTINGTTYPAGTKFTVLKTAAGEFVPVATSGAVATGAAAATAAATGAAVSGGVVAGAVAFTAVVVVASTNNGTTATTATTP